MSRVSIVRLDDYKPENVKRAMEQLLEPLGGIEAFVTPDCDVVLKPNFLAPRDVDSAVCTHPQVIRAVADLVSKHSKNIVVTDSGGMGSATRCAKKLGLANDITFVVKDADDGIDASQAGSTFNHLTLSRRMLEADSLINIAKAKTHGQMTITCAVKNTYGAVVGLEKAQWHLRAGSDYRRFAQLLLHVHSLVAPKLNILDAVVCMEGNGPGSGEPRKLGLLLASTDPHAIDLIMCKLWSVNPKHVKTLTVAMDQGLVSTLDEIEIVGPSLEEIQPSKKWKLATPVLHLGPAWAEPIVKRLLSLRPKVNKSACIACGHCIPACAAQAIVLTPEAVIDNKKCISCFCCQEMCPKGAITVSAGPIARLLGLVGK